MTTMDSAKAANFFQLNAKTPAGRDVPFSTYEGKVILVVNTATQCGLTPQFEGLEKLYEQYKDRGLMILGFPCNQFAGQEPLSNAEMEQTCRIDHGVTFPLFEKIEVNGQNTHPVFRWLKSKLGGLFGRRIKWNFTKFLIDRKGKAVKRFAPVTKPGAIEPWIKSLLSILIVLLSAHLQGHAQGNHASSDDIVIGKRQRIHSDILKEDRTIWVHLPNEYYPGADNGHRYPVIYLLDGNDHFSATVGTIHRLCPEAWNDLCPNMIVVGILNTDRMRDLTPTHVGGDDNLGPAAARTTGGGEAFTAFIQKELIPHIDSLYPTEPYRMLIGHSLGGLIVVNTLINHPDLFNAYLAIDPSLWWDDQKLLQQAETELRNRQFKGKTLFLAIANTMQPGMDTLRIQSDTARNSLHIRSILRFEHDLANDKENGLRWSSKYYDGDSHGTVPLPAGDDGIRFCFDFFHFPEKSRMSDPACSPSEALKLMRDHYRKVSEGFGFPMDPPADELVGWGDNFASNKQPEKGLAFYKYALSLHRNLSGSIQDKIDKLSAQMSTKP